MNVKLTAEQRYKLLGSFINPFLSNELTLVNEEQPGGCKCPTITLCASNVALNIYFEFKALLSIETLYELGIDATPFLTEDHDGETEEE